MAALLQRCRLVHVARAAKHLSQTALAALVRDLLVPGSISFLLLGATVAVAALYGGGRRAMWGRRALVLLLGGYWLLSLPMCAALLERGLGTGQRQLASKAAAAGADTIVVLSGGGNSYGAPGLQIQTPSSATAMRTLEAIRVYRLLGEPLVILSGGIGDPQVTLAPESDVMQREMLRAGVPVARLVMETRSQNTRDEAVEVARMLAERGIGRFVLVTSAQHMRRALATFRAVGLDPVPAATAAPDDDQTHARWQLLPSSSALRASQSAMREVLATAYYWWRGWLRFA